LLKRGNIIHRKIKGHSDRGRNPKESSSSGSSPKERRPFSIDVKGGEIVTLM
jgi:hypothetical protein